MTDPKDIFKKFGRSARQILISSQKIAENMRSGIGSEHILLAMTANSGTISYEILKENAVSLDQVKLILSLNNIRTNINKGLSQEAKNILTSSAKKAAEFNNPSIESEHLLWAILADKSCRANQIINRIGVNVQDFKEQIEEIFQELKNAENQTNQGLDLFNLGNFSLQPNFAFPSSSATTFKKNRASDSATPFLDQYGTNLTLMAKENKLDPVIGREKEINRAIQILCRRNKNNPVLVGEPGVGKTAIVEGLAQKIHSQQVPEILKDKKIINLDLPLVVAGTMYRGQFEDRIKKIISEVIKVKNIILFIDELHTIIGAGSAEGSMDAANIFKPILVKEQIRLIGATTSEEYRKYIEKDLALERRLQVIKVNEPSLEETIEILHGIKANYEKHHQIKIADQAIIAAAKLAKRFISDRYLPDKAIDLIDEASASKRISVDIGNVNKETVQIKQKLAEINRKKIVAVENQDYQQAAFLKTQEIKLNQELNKTQQKSIDKNETYVNEKDIAEIVSMWTGIPLENLIKTEQKKLLLLEKTLKSKIVGQKEAIKEITQAIKRSKSGISDPNRPIGAFIFLGPTGVGKTELAKVLAQEIYANDNSLIKIDMSEFGEKHTIARLTGAPPGYIGYEDAGKLTEAVRKNPYSLILLDEIEKAHPEIFNILLQIIEDGYLTDAKGKKVNFRNTIIILTSNIGMQELTRQAAIGFKTSGNQKQKFAEKYAEMKQSILTKLKDQFRPELLNRLDKIIVFRPLDKASIIKIVKLQIDQLISRLKEQDLTIIIDNRVINHLAKIGYDPEYGARPIKRKIAELIENPISDILLSQKTSKKHQLKIKMSKGKINIKIL